MRPHLVVLLLILPALAGCLQDAPPRVPADGDGDATDGTNGDGAPADDDGLTVHLGSADLAEGDAAVLLFKNGGAASLTGTLVIDLLDPHAVVIARHEEPTSLAAGSSLTFTWHLPSFLEDGTYTWNASLDGETATATAVVDGSALPGEGPPAHDAPDRVWGLSADLPDDRALFYPDEDLILTLTNTGNGNAVGAANVTLHHAPDNVPYDDPLGLAALVTRVVDLSLAPGDAVTLAPFRLPASQVPAGLQVYYFHVEWRHGSNTLPFQIENRTIRPEANPGTLERTWDVAPTNDWEGNDSITLDGATHGAWLHYPTQADVDANEASPSLASTETYRNTIRNAFTTAWANYTEQGWLMPEMPIHVYVDNPGGQALGTARQTDYGAHVIIGPQALHDNAGADVSATASHELFHVVQASYDLQEGFLVEGTAAWVQDKPHGTLDYLGHARQFLNEPDRAPLQYREYELGLFLYWVEDTYGFHAVKGIVENTTHYDNEEAVAVAVGQPFDDLWVAFLNDLAARNVRHADELFQKEGVFGLRAWKWIYDDAETRVSDEAAARTLDLPLSVSQEEKERMMDEDVGRVKHAYGFDAFNLTADTDVDPANDDVNLTFEALDAGTDHVVLLARHDGTDWAVTPVSADDPVLVEDVKDTWTIVYVARLASGTGAYDLVMEPA